MIEARKYPIHYIGAEKKRDFGTFEAASFDFVPSYLIGVNEDRRPLVDMTPYFPTPDFEKIDKEIMENCALQTDLTFPANPISGQQPPEFFNGRYHLSELFFQLDEISDKNTIDELIAIDGFWDRYNHLSSRLNDRSLEWGFMHELKFAGPKWQPRARALFPNLIAYLNTIPMEIDRAYILVYRPGEHTSVHRDNLFIDPDRPSHTCIMSFKNRAHPTFMYDPILKKKIPFPSWATAFNYCDYHGGMPRPTNAYSYSVGLYGWFDGIGGYKYQTPVWQGDWEFVKRTPNSFL